MGTDIKSLFELRLAVADLPKIKGQAALLRKIDEQEKFHIKYRGGQELMRLYFKESLADYLRLSAAVAKREAEGGE